MNTINLDLIKPSSNRIRKTWDEDKMQELAQSIKEQGVIVPIKVRPPDDMKPCRSHGWSGVDGEGSAYDSGTGYTCEGCVNTYIDPDNLDDYLEDGFDPRFEIVYGHRRVEAARRAGLGEIPAIVEGVKNNDALIEALIENIVREDMKAIEIATALKHLKLLTKWTNDQIARQLGWKDGRGVSNYLVLLNLPTKLQSVGVQHVIQAKAGTNNLDDAAKVLEKAEREDLSSGDTRKIADAYVKADTSELKKAVLETEIKKGDVKLSTPDAILREASRKIGREYAADFDRKIKDEKKKDKLQIRDSAVKEFITQTDTYRNQVNQAASDADYGRYSPEAARFVIGKLENLQLKIDDLVNILESVK